MKHESQGVMTSLGVGMTASMGGAGGHQGPGNTGGGPPNQNGTGGVSGAGG